MTILIIILLVVAGFVGLLLIVAIFQRKQHFVKRGIIIHAPLTELFNFLKLLKNQDTFNKHAIAGDRHREFKGIDGTVGYIYAWHGDKNAGAGEKEIIKIIEGKKIETEIRFVKPMKVKATVIMETEAVSDSQTGVYWTNTGILPYPVNILIPMMEKSVAKDMDSSLLVLKEIFEKGNRK